MIVVANNIEAKLLEIIKSLKGDAGEHYALHFHLSRLQDHYRSEFQLRIAVNILNDVFRQADGFILPGRDADIFVVYHGNDKGMLDKAIFQLRYLFVDDPLANHEDGTENDDFCTLYDLVFQWRAFYRLCVERMSMAAQVEMLPARPMREERNGVLTPLRLSRIEAELESLDLELAVRKQPVCAIQKAAQSMRPVFYEIYVNMGHLRRLLANNCDLTADKWLFKYLTEMLDGYVIRLLGDRAGAYLAAPVSLNLSVKTVLSEGFSRFMDKIRRAAGKGIVVEIQITDVFVDMAAFLAAKDIVHGHGCRICLDGLDNISFVQVDRESLGFDLAKLRWNADMKGDLGSPENRKLSDAIKRCGSNRMILCRCDSVHAIEYGQALGISLFQGRHPDRVLDPDGKIIN